MAAPVAITTAQLARLIGTPDTPVLVDICIPPDFEADPRVVPGAIRWSHAEIDALVPQMRDRNVVVICQKGIKLSQGAAALLRTHGIAAEYLEGGNWAWRDAGLPLVPWEAIPPRRPDPAVPWGASLWVTRHRPKIDRIACPWLIRRFVDPSARFLFVSPAEVMGVAERFGATPFDVEDVFWSHRGERCSFDTMVEEFALATPPLERLATIVRGADTNRHDLAPQAAGLLAVSLGLSRMYRDDLAQLEQGMGLYDAFYRWCRDAVDEGHDWPSALPGT